MDITAISVMSHDDLAMFLSTTGDRVAVMQFCTSKLDTSTATKQSLIEQLKEKIRVKSAGRMPSKVTGNVCGIAKSTQKQVKFGKSVKMTRVIELGWRHNNLQVKAREGGGTREVAVPKTDCKKELITLGKSLFIVEADTEIFSFDICDFKLQPIDEFVTVGEMYDTCHFRRMKFYLQTCDRHLQTDSGDEFLEFSVSFFKIIINLSIHG